MNHRMQSGCRLLRDFVRFPGILVLLFTILPGTALGQDTSSRPSLGSGPEPASEKELQDPEESTETAPTRRRRLAPFKRPVLTEEQREEAERLRKLAAKYGTDPTAIVGRIQLSSTYSDLPRGARASDTIARVDLPFKKDYLLRLDAPFLRWSAPTGSGATGKKGISDIAVTAGWRMYNTPEYAVFVGVVSTMPTASETILGLGKYTVGPTIATGRIIVDWDSFLFGLFTQPMSVGGDPARNDLNFSRLIIAMNTLWEKRWWSTAQAVLEADWERKGKTGMAFEFEVGRNIVGTWGMFARPGVGIFGQGVGTTYDWNVEVGIRRTFKSF